MGRLAGGSVGNLGVFFFGFLMGWSVRKVGKAVRCDICIEQNDGRSSCRDEFPLLIQEGGNDIPNSK